MIDGDTPESEEEPLAEDEAPSAADPAQIRRQTARAKKSKDQRGDFWRAVFAEPVGRAEMWRLLKLGDAFGEEFFACGPNGFPQDQATFFKAGQRELVRGYLREWMAMATDGVLAMHRENDPLFALPKRAKKKAE